MDIEFKVGEDAAISTCQQILSYNDQASSEIENLRESLNRINTNWESNGNDKQSYVEELEKQVKNLGHLIDSIKILANTIINYAETNKETSSKTVTS